MSAHFLDDERLADLLVLEVTEGLEPAARAELDRLLAATPEASADALAQAAAAVTLAARLPLEPLPADLRATLVKQGETVVRVKAGNKVQALPVRAPQTAPKAPPATVAPTRDAGSGRYGWYAAAASLLIALAAWWPRLGEAPPPAVVEAPAPNPVEGREALLASPSVLRQEWTRTEDPAAVAVTGDVVWDEATQTGYMRFAGLPPNDPTREQYQLWIFDGTRDDRYPVDGGVFDIPAGATEVVIPIKATLPVRKAAMFAVTVEPPGGVMVSSRERIVALAQVASG